MLLENNSNSKGLQLIDTDDANPEISIMKEFKALVEDHFRKEKDPEFYAKKLNIKIPRLNSLTRIYFGNTVYRLLQGRIHEEAVLLLTYTSLSIKQITYELDISDQAYFCRCFKKISGLRPTEYRKMYGATLPPLFFEELNDRGSTYKESF